MEKEKLSTVLADVKQEALRFIKKLDECQERINKESESKYGTNITKENGAVRRAALDLKNELTRITQSHTW